MMCGGEHIRVFVFPHTSSVGKALPNRVDRGCGEDIVPELGEETVIYSSDIG